MILVLLVNLSVSDFFQNPSNDVFAGLKKLFKANKLALNFDITLYEICY
jgi:hypothetical protein